MMKKHGSTQIDQRIRFFENFGPVEISTAPPEFSVVGNIEILQKRSFEILAQNDQKWGLDRF